MNEAKVNKVVGQLMRSGFSMTSEEFYKTTMDKLLRKYHITEQLTVDEYIELIRQLIDICATQDLNDMGYGIYDPDDLRYK